jgi:AAA+ superfamily predicted ATPase
LVLADLLLQRAALRARVSRDRMPDPLAGLKVDDDDVDQLLSELPGLAEGTDEEGKSLRDLELLLAPAVADAQEEFVHWLESGTPFAGVAARAGLTPAEAQVLAVVCAVDLDPRRQRLVGYLNDDVTQRRVTPWTLGLIFGAPMSAHLAVGPGGTLRRAALVAAPGDGPWASNPVSVAPSVLWWLSGDRSLDPDLPPGVEVVAGPPSPPDLPDRAPATVTAAGFQAAPALVTAAGPDRLQAAPELVTAAGLQAAPALVTAAGPDRLRRLQAAVTALPGELFLVTPVPASREQWDAVVRQATLADLGVVIEVDDELTAEARYRIEHAGHLAWAVISPRDLPLTALPRRPWVDLAVGPSPATPEEWQATMGQAPPEQYHLTADQLHLVGRATSAMGGDIPAAVRRLAAGHIDAAAARVRPSRTWDDIILDDDRLGQLREVAVRCRQRDTVFGQWGFSPQPSTGVVALFAGPSGTGKTLAAEVIAGDLGVDLYKIDLANLVSKYIGETEKNLSRVFDAAEASSVALFFDEADALLGRRSEVSDAHDRYANIEVAYLLQRLERYEGLVVLATNLAKNIDPAFLRRLHVVVEFPMPGPAERRRIWAHCLPSAAPTGADLDLDFLADGFELSGGTIRNAVLAAAFLAAEAGTPITMAAAVVALRRELQKLGRLVRPEDFGRHASAIPGDRAG